MKTRSIRKAPSLTMVLTTLIVLLVLSVPALAHRSLTNTAGAFLMPVGAHDQMTLVGGSCSSCGKDDGKDDGHDGGTVSKVGSPYWKTYKSTVLSRTSTPAQLLVKVNNYSATLSITESYGYTSKSSLSVGFSGGYASYVTASVGGEYSKSKHEETTIVVPPKTSAKAYIKYWTEQVMRYGQRLQDYSEITDDPFDAVVSLEMGEHVGEADYPHYARTLHDNAKPGARVLIQQMSRTGKHPGGGPFIESFITPDMTMRPVGETVSHLESAGLEVGDVQSLREHYVWTVSAWLDSFEAHWSEIVAMVGVEMARVWRLYLVGGRLSFEQGRMGVDQLLAVRPTAAGRSSMPAVRSDLPPLPQAVP